jgi:hypothetical protein
MNFIMKAVKVMAFKAIVPTSVFQSKGTEN